MLVSFVSIILSDVIVKKNKGNTVLARLSSHDGQDFFANKAG